MTTLYLCNEAGLPADEWSILVQAVQYFVPLVTKAWKLPATTVATSPVEGAWTVLVTDRSRRPNATGYHTVESGLPVAYCSPRAAYRPYGRYYPAFSLRGKQLFPARYSEGLITTICHEIAEMLCDPKISTVSAVDSQGRAWLVEVCDHVFGSYLIQLFSGTTVVLPDVTTPSYYSMKGKAPYSLNSAISAPFTLTSKGYAYYKSADGSLVKI